MNRNHKGGSQGSRCSGRPFPYKHRLGPTLGYCKLSTTEISNSSQRKRPGLASTLVLYSRQRLPSGLPHSERHGPCRWSTVPGFKGRMELRPKASGPAQLHSKGFKSPHTTAISILPVGGHRLSSFLSDKHLSGQAT